MKSSTDIKQHILATGRTLILGKGFTAVGLNEILSTAGVPKGSFYYYFKSKEAFGVALAEAYFADYLVRADSLLAGDVTPAAQRLMRYWQSWLTTGENDCLESSCLVVKLSAEVSDLSEAMRMALLNGTRQIIERLASCLRQGAVDGSLSGLLDAPQTALALYELWLGAALLTKLRRERSALDTAMFTTLRLLGLPSQVA
jgi:TetR/AcrR family transcriptional repressor of nem operon